MREQLEQYVKLLFAGTPDSEDMQQEILQNTLDRYDDLLDQGKSPEAAYRLAISGIGDINEMLGASSPAPAVSAVQEQETKSNKKLLRAVAIAMYIASVIPVIALGNIGNGGIGVCMMLLLIAAATVLIVLSSGENASKEKDSEKEPTHPAYKAYQAVSGAVTLAVYLLVSFLTHAWHITWLIFLIFAAIDGIVRAIFDLKEAK
jgi:hypothetical protein